MPARWVTPALAAVLLAVQAQLWFGQGSVPHVMQLRSQLAAQQAVNDEARLRNEQLAVEVGDLKEGLEMVEEMEVLRQVMTSSGAFNSAWKDC